MVSDECDVEAEAEIASGEVKKHIGRLLVEEGHKLRMLGEEEMALEMETIGRNMIEGVREIEGGDRTFEDSLLDVE